MKKSDASPVPFAPWKYAHWIFIVAAAVIMAVRLIPANYLAVLDSDNVQIPLLYHDLFGNGGHLHDWNWGGHSDLFPDVLLGFAMRWLTGNGLLTLQAGGSVLFVMLAGALVVLYWQNVRRNTAFFAALLLLFFVGVVGNFGVGHGVSFAEIFTYNIHAGIQIMALVCLALGQRACLEGGWKSFWFFSCICILTTASDILFLTVFTIPFAMTLVAARLVYPARIRLFIPMVVNLAGSTVAGLLLARRIFPIQTTTPSYLHFTVQRVSDSLSELFKILSPSAGGYFIVLLTLNAVVVLSAAWLFAILLRRRGETKIPAMLVILVLFGGFMILCNWGAALATGNYTGIACTRYVRLSLLWPVYLLLGYGAALLPQSSARYAATLVSVIATVCASVFTPRPGSFYTAAQQILPLLRSTMDKEGIEAGFADYWWANSLTLLSGETVKLRSIDPGGSLYFWINNITWFTGDAPVTPAPRFRVIFTAKLDLEKIRQRYGEPSHIIPAGEGDIWVYPKNKSIVFNRILGGLSNDPLYANPDRYHVAAAALPSMTGRIAGDAIVAIEGRDKEGRLSYGPYICPTSGLYRISIGYSYLARPAEGKPVVCDFLLQTPSREKQLGGADLPFLDAAHHQLTHEVAISNDAHDPFEVRTFYHGSGSIRLESLDIQFLKSR